MSAEAIPGTISLSDMESSYELGSHNEGTSGGMNLRFTVNSPAGASEVNVWTWSQKLWKSGMAMVRR